MKAPSVLILGVMVAIAPVLGCKKSAGELATYDVVADAPGDPSHPADVHVEVHAGELHLTPGGVHVVGGAAKTNVSDLAPVVTIAGYRVDVTQGKPGMQLSDWGLGLIADYRLTLGTTPMTLSVNNRAGSTELELGGLPLKSLHVGGAAGPTRVAFSAPNPLAADTLDVVSSAGPLTMTDVGRFGASAVRVQTQAGSVALSFGSKVDREVSVDISSAAGGVKLSLPPDVTARADVKTEAGAIKLNGWNKDGESYVLGNPGPSPRVHVQVKTGAGGVTLDTGS